MWRGTFKCSPHRVVRRSSRHHSRGIDQMAESHQRWNGPQIKRGPLKNFWAFDLLLQSSNQLLDRVGVNLGILDRGPDCTVKTDVLNEHVMHRAFAERPLQTMPSRVVIFQGLFFRFRCHYVPPLCSIQRFPHGTIRDPTMETIQWYKDLECQGVFVTRTVRMAQA